MPTAILQPGDFSCCCSLLKTTFHGIFLAVPAPQEHVLLSSSPWESSDDGGTASLPAAPAVNSGCSPPDSLPTNMITPYDCSCCCTSQLPQEHHSPSRHNQRVPTMVIQHISLLHQRWVVVASHRTPCPSPSESSGNVGTASLPAAPAVGCSCFQPDSPCASHSRLVIPSSPSRARPCSNIIAHEAASDPNFFYSARKLQAIRSDCRVVYERMAFMSCITGLHQGTGQGGVTSARGSSHNHTQTQKFKYPIIGLQRHAMSLLSRN